MSVAEIKKTKLNLIAWIEQLSDVNMLTVLDGLRSSKSDNDWWDNLTENQKQHINEGLNDVENGRVVSSEVFWDKLRNG
jgi:ABC-type Mn2+/Zn2+ transport system ATPase subunit